MSTKKKEFSSLDSVFNRLQVTPPGERVNDETNSTTSKTKPSTRILNSGDVVPPQKDDTKSLELLIGQKLNIKRKGCKPKSVIRKAKLILPKKFSLKKENEANEKNDNDTDDEEVPTNEFENVDELNESPVTCGAQYLQQGTSLPTAAVGSEDSSPDELASYFEQILYIPKPMSLMAQMMYA